MEGRAGMSTAAGAALEPFGQLPTWLVDVTKPGRLAASLQRAVPELADGRIRLLEAAVEGLRVEGVEWRVRCRVRALAADGPRTAVLVGRIVPPDEAAGPAREDTAAAFAEPGWTCRLGDLRLLLEAAAADASLPALPALLDPVHAAALLQRSLRGAGHQVEVAGCVPEVVRSKHGSRVTILYRMRYAGCQGPNPLVAKIHQGDEGRVAWEALRTLWAQPIAAGSVVTLAEPLAYLPEQRVLVQGPVPEEHVLKDVVRDALADGSPELLDEVRTHLDRTASGLAALHCSGARYGRVVVWEEALVGMRDVVSRVAMTVPQIAMAAEPLLGRLEVLADAAGPDPQVGVHHDFRPAQVLLHGGRVGFVDFDGACTAEPALDVGGFRAKLRYVGVGTPRGTAPLTGHALDQRLRLIDGLCDDFLAAYRRHADVTSERVVLWEVTDLIAALLGAWTRVRVHRVGPRLAALRHVLATAALPEP
jgi:Phosphotransferase enzyme family